MPRTAISLLMLLAFSCTSPSASLPSQVKRSEVENAECHRDGKALVYRLAQGELRLEQGELLWLDEGKPCRLALASLRHTPSFGSGLVLHPILPAMLRQGLSDEETAMILGPSEFDAGIPVWPLSDERQLLWPEVAHRLGVGPMIRDSKGRIGPAIDLPKLR
jgi:hypothetical protein